MTSSQRNPFPKGSDVGTLDGQVAIVTGGGRGLGLAIAERLIGEGAAVVIAGRNTEVLAKAEATLTHQGGQTHAVTADVAEQGDVERLVDAALAWGGRIDVLVNNAGIADQAALVDIRLDDWERVIRTNLTAPFMLTQRVATEMSNGGSVINLASIDAYAADGPFASYVAAKAGLIGLTKAAAVELASSGIRVNSVSPGWALTDMAVESTTPATLAHMKSDFARVPMRRLIDAAEVANAVCFLASPLASGITGTDLTVDGGTLANLFILETLPSEEQS